MVSLVIGVGFKVDAEKYITFFSFGINYNVKIILKSDKCKVNLQLHQPNTKIKIAGETTTKW